ncbi:MAG: hypothetical protein EPO28_03185, partial [Saprospiraceae bacterium]
MKHAIIPFLFLIIFCEITGAQVIYVHGQAQGSNDGTSWASAFTDLQAALSVAQPGDSVWVAQGTYFPTQDSDRTVYFELKNGVRLFGGFAATETALNERDWETNHTILSGDIGVLNDSTDNSLTILYMENADTTTAVDGFVFQKGNADDGSGGFTGLTAIGGAMYINGEAGFAYPRIRNCRFERNYALLFGGAVYVNGSNNGSVAPRFYNCVFEQNHAGSDGGAIYRAGGSWVEVKNDFWNCTFTRNRAENHGGAILYLESERTDTIEFTGCKFIENEAGKSGGGIAYFGGRDIGAKVIIGDCSFIKNKARKGGGYYCLPWNFLYTDLLLFKNSEF